MYLFILSMWTKWFCCDENLLWNLSPVPQANLILGKIAILPVLKPSWNAGETENPQGVVNTSDGRVVRAFHRFTLVDQLNQNRDLTKGRRRDQGAVKISCARQANLLISLVSYAQYDWEHDKPLWFFYTVKARMKVSYIVHIANELCKQQSFSCQKVCNGQNLHAL